MKQVSVAVTNEVYEKFVGIQKKHGFSNQSDCLEFVINQVAENQTAEVKIVG